MNYLTALATNYVNPKCSPKLWDALLNLSPYSTYSTWIEGQIAPQSEEWENADYVSAIDNDGDLINFLFYR